MKLHTPTEHITDPEIALAMLKEGNARFVENHLSDKSTYEVDRKALDDAQSPFAVIICCSDSRVVPEVFFDQRLGDIFVIRNAGNVVDNVVLGSVEYALDALECPLIVVCGHSHCGAITAACQGGHMTPHLDSILKRISPYVEDKSDVDAAILANIRHVVQEMQQDDVARDRHVRVVGAYYDIATGVVSWL